jgi:hypothetical protein
VLSDGKAPPAARVQAATAILDRGWGKPTVGEADDDGKQVLNVVIRKLTDGG